MVPAPCRGSVSAMALRWQAEITSGNTQQTERTKENPKSAPEAEAVTFGIGLAQTQHSRTRRCPTNIGLSDIVGGVIHEFAVLAGETMKTRGTRWHPELSKQVFRR